MPAYVALLRGINVGGKRSLPMAKVRRHRARHARRFRTARVSGATVRNWRTVTKLAELLAAAT